MIMLVEVMLNRFSGKTSTMMMKESKNLLKNVIICIYGLLQIAIVESEILIAEEGPFAGFVLETSKINEFHSSYIGCFHPGFQDPGFPYKAQIPDVHVTACVLHCRQHNFTFAGLKGGRSCLCGDSHYKDYTENCKNDRLMKCTGNAQEICGGKNDATSVYRVCPPGMYGAGCTEACECLNNGCYMNGSCIPGCGVGQELSPGGDICINGCHTSFFGLGCVYYNPNCKGGTVHPLNGFCISGCKVGFSIYCTLASGIVSDDNPDTEVCPLCENCRPKHCYGSGYTFYHLRCPVDWSGQGCTACEPGYWGRLCEKRCAANCSCPRDNPFCTRCHDPHVHGPDCSLPCPANCAGGTCLATGTCDECVPGTLGERCERCVDGLRGALCDERCPEQCGGACDLDSGACVRSEACRSGWFGPECDFTCSAACAGACDQRTGVCEECAEGYHGPRCEFKCEFCDGACNRTTAACLSSTPCTGPLCVSDLSHDPLFPTKNPRRLQPMHYAMFSFLGLVGLVGLVFLGLLHASTRRPRVAPLTAMHDIPDITVDNVGSQSSRISIFSRFSNSGSGGGAQVFTQNF